MDPSLAHLISWSEQTRGEVPPALTGPAMIASPIAPVVYLFGGKFVHNRKLTNEMWAIDLATRSWRKVDNGTGPSPRYFHSLDVWEDKLVCFGGMSESEPDAVHNDLWFYDCSSGRWTCGSGTSPGGTPQDPAMIPAPRYAHLAAVSRGKLVVSGGQHADNTWIHEINIYDLRRRLWISKTAQPEAQGLHSKGAYRSVSSSSKQRVITPQGGEKTGSMQSYSIDEDGEGGDIWCYSNYDFAKVRRELDLYSPINDGRTGETESSKHIPPPAFDVHDQSSRMKGSAQPPGLRFPTGGIVGKFFILCGLYLASTSAAFSIYALDLDTMLWKHLEPAALQTGSWNRAVLAPDQARIYVFGNTQYDLASDYSRRAVNLDYMAIVNLETYGIYRPPRLEIPTKIQEAGLTMLDEKLASDFDVISDDGRVVRCSRQLLSDRWPWFKAQERSLEHKLSSAVKDAPALDITDTLLGSFTPARLAATSLTIPEPMPVCIALVQYFYTLSLSTPLQNRAPVLSALLFLSKQYKIDRLGKLVIHALHARLEPAIAVGIYEIATLAGEQPLQVRALNMIHSNKAGSSSRHPRQGPSSSAVEDKERSDSPAPTQGGSSSAAAQSSSSGQTAAPSSQSTADVPYRRARAESFTLAHDESAQVGSLLAALEVHDRRNGTSPTLPPAEPAPLTVYPTPPIPRRSNSRPKPPFRPPPLGRLPDPLMSPDHCLPDLTRPSSPTGSEATSHYPSTPAESVRESFILPPRDYYMDSRSSSHSSQGYLPPLPEDAKLLRRAGTLIGQASADRLKQSTFESAGMFSRPPPLAYSSYQAQQISSAQLHDPFARLPPSGNKHFSVATHSSTASISSTSSRPESKLGHHPESPVTEYHVDFDDYRSASLRSRQDILAKHADRFGSHMTMASSVTMTDNSSIMTGSSGNSDKKAAKAEMKAIAAADKAAKKAEAQARFEALRSEQMTKLAVAKVEAQRKADSAKFDPPKPKAAPKSKLGKFGAKFSDAVLFPAGGSNSTMF